MRHQYQCLLHNMTQTLTRGQTLGHLRSSELGEEQHLLTAADSGYQMPLASAAQLQEEASEPDSRRDKPPETASVGGTHNQQAARNNHVTGYCKPSEASDTNCPGVSTGDSKQGNIASYSLLDEAAT